MADQMQLWMKKPDLSRQKRVWTGMTFIWTTTVLTFHLPLRNSTGPITTIIIITISHSLPLLCVEIALYHPLRCPSRALFLVPFCDQNKCLEALRLPRKRIVMQTVQCINISSSTLMDTATTIIITHIIPNSAGTS